MKRQQIIVQGIVQGVGFRPFIFTLAKRLSLSGWVLNNAQGVLLEIQGQEAKVAEFIRLLPQEAPPLAQIMQVDVTDRPPIDDESQFVIRPSEETEQHIALISPDMAPCAACDAELNDPTDRRYGYAFINCTHCGPRYTIVRDIPYDRPLTTMAKFTMCPDCQGEYDDPTSRRFHAQPNACSVCGPHYWLTDAAGKTLSSQDASAKALFEQARGFVINGQILAVKGIGGFHLCCNAVDEAAVTRLRDKKFRWGKPLAVMAGSLAKVKEICEVSPEEEKFLTGQQRPIVLLAKRNDQKIAAAVAPDTAYLGVMLPYAPVHTLLLAPNDLWVMTSGNPSDEPLAYQDEAALTRLQNIADAFLLHNREIYRPIDDSVGRIVRKETLFFRRSRGFVPAPLTLTWEMPQVLAAGGEQKNTFCLTRGLQAFLSAHIGDLENQATYDHYSENITHLRRLTHIEPECVAYDLHPRYFSTQYALTCGLPVCGVQHHHAHIVSVMAEYGISEPVIGVAFDGTGYGTDGTLWGGEFFVAGLTDFERVAHLAPFPLPGGAKAIAEPWRLAVSWLHRRYGEALTTLNLPVVHALPDGWRLVAQAAEKGIASPLTSSAGRLFDTAAALLGIRPITQYEGQAAIDLEQLAGKTAGVVLPYSLGADGTLDFTETLAALTQGVLQGENTAELAAAFQYTVGDAIVQTVRQIGRKRNLHTVALGGGVFQNLFLLNYVSEKLNEHRFQVLWNRQIPPNDGGLSLGQAVVAGMRRKQGCV